MPAFLRYVWKEWRDQRGVALGCAIGVTLLLVLAAVFLPDSIRKDGVFPMVAALGCFGLGVIAIAAEILPSESRRGTLRFLARLPRGLQSVFWAKTLVAGTLLVALGVYGWVAASVLGTPDVDPRLLRAIPIAVCCGVWVFAVSSWLPRGALALPGALVTLGAFALPVYFAWSAFRLPLPRPVYFVTGFVLLLAGGVAATWWSFAGGRRFGRGIWSSAWRGLLLTLCLFTPAWAYAAAEVHDVTSAPDVARARTFIGGRPQFGPGFRYAFVDAYTKRLVAPNGAGVPKPIVVDLHTGEWRAVGQPGDHFRFAVGYGATPRVVELLDTHERGNRRGHLWIEYFDTKSGERVHRGWSDMEPESVTQLRGSRVSPRNRFAGRDLVVFDRYRKREYKVDRGAYFILESGWIARIGRNAKWRRFDPERRECHGPEVPSPGVALDAHRYTHGTSVVDLRDGSVTKVMDADWINWMGARSDGVRVATVMRGGRCTWVHIDPESLAVREFDGILSEYKWDEFTHCAFDGDTMLGVWKSNQIIRVSLDTGQHEVLFPR